MQKILCRVELRHKKNTRTLFTEKRPCLRYGKFLAVYQASGILPFTCFFADMYHGLSIWEKQSRSVGPSKHFKIPHRSDIKLFRAFSFLASTPSAPPQKKICTTNSSCGKAALFWSSNISKILQMGERVATFALQFDFPSQWLWKFRKDYRMKRQCQKSNSTPSEIGATKCWRNPSRRKKRYFRNPRKERQKPVLEPTSD